MAARHSILSEREPKAKREVRIEAVPASKASWNILGNHGDMQCLRVSPGCKTTDHAVFHNRQSAGMETHLENRIYREAPT